jgi:ribosomal protein L21E
MPNKFKVGDRVKVKDVEFTGEDAKEANECRGKVGTITEIDPTYCFPYTVTFDDYWSPMLFNASHLEKA